jgi:hypothetical protein|tara:strand:- start:23829 stop:24053 length:225 start_codon:yes stop_codon:yes gene_type:complete
MSKKPKLFDWKFYELFGVKIIHGRLETGERVRAAVVWRGHDCVGTDKGEFRLNGDAIEPLPSNSLCKNPNKRIS